MEDKATRHTDEQHIHPKPDKHIVTVTVDSKPHQVPRGEYIVSEFKKLVGVAPERALDEVVGNHFKPRDDNDRIHIHGGEVFVSHVRTGGSS